MACEAKQRRRYNDPGWECDGTDLIYLMDAPGGVPMVAPTRLLDDFMAEPWAGSLYRPQPFKGGDHFHAIRPDLKPPAVSTGG